MSVGIAVARRLGQRIEKECECYFLWRKALETLENVEVSLLVFTHRGADSGRNAQESTEL